VKTASPTTPCLHAADTTASAAASAARGINRLHTEAQRLAAESRHSLDETLAAAWHAGRLLIAEKKRIRGTAGHGSWLPWLEHFFEGSTRTAHRYMRLARTVSDPAFLQGLSLRQAYARLGIATEPKRPAHKTGIPLPGPPEHILLAGKLVRFLRQAAASENQQNYVRDLAVLYRQLHALYSKYPVNRNFLPENSKHLPDDFL
jgi:hypothetical protein